MKLITNLVAVAVAAVIISAVSGCRVQAQGTFWQFYQSASTAYVASSTPTTNYYNNYPWNLDGALGINSTTYSMEYSINAGNMTLTRNNNYGLGAALALLTSPIQVPQGSSLELASWVNSGTGGQFASISNIKINGISYSGSTMATTANPFSELTFNLTAILTGGAQLTSVSYEYTSGASSPSVLVDAGHQIVVGVVPEPSTVALLVGGISAVLLMRRKK